MNAHASPAPETPPKRRWSWKRFGGKFLVISIGAHLLLGLAATIWVVQSYSANRKLTFKGGPPSPNASTRALEHKVQLAKKTSAMTAPPMNKRITSTGISKVTLPDMPTLPKSPTTPTKMAGAGGVGIGLSGSTMGAAGPSGGGAVPSFGFREPRGGGALVGTFYDLKQLADGKPSPLAGDPNATINDNAKEKPANQAYEREVASFVGGGWNPATLAKYFQGSTPLYATEIFVPQLKAEEGPRAFGLAGKVQARRWLVHYVGKVIPDETATYRFVGFGDDLITVRFDKKIVLDQGSIRPSGTSPARTFVYGYDKESFYTDVVKGHGEGQPFKVTAGNSYDMDVLIGEMPGGFVQFQLLLEKEGAEYKKDPKGNPILPVFKLAPSNHVDSKDLPPSATEGPIWKAEKLKASGSSVLGR